MENNNTSLIFNPKENIMKALSELNTKEVAQQWYKEYLEYHNGQCQGIRYMIGYLDHKKRNLLIKWLFK